ncbi:MAG: Transcription elongation factor Spt5 [Methanomassiliicoccales archaeon PtaU1.Bin124]|nr:MAG: Transcription elongation factor Spt5 [Methanomassiliicoccales archaeon PtaU1.Bin124]
MNENVEQQAAPAVGGGAISLVGQGSQQNVTAGSKATWNIQVKSSDSAKHSVVVRIIITYEPGAPEWEVKLGDSSNVMYDSSALGEPIAKFNLEGSRPKELKLTAEAPRGARFDDIVKIDLELADGSNGKLEFSAVAKQSIMILKTSIGHERNVADGVASKVKDGKTGVFAMLSPEKLDGYVIVEGMNTDLVHETVRGVRKSKGLVEGETKFSEIEHFLTPKPLVSGIMEGDVVELVAGPFKGEKARVQKIDESKEEITVELFEATVPIPVTVRGDHVRVLEKEK